MSGWANRPLRAVVEVNHKPRWPEQSQTVWSLGLDQIEPDTGRVLNKTLVAANKLGSSTYPFEVGTVLYSKLRPYLNKVLVADQPGVATTELVPLRCDPEHVVPEYLAYFLRSPEFLRFATTVVAGAKMPRMVMSEFWAYEIPLPPLPEQRRITAILDQANTLRAKRREALAQLDNLRQSIFIEMFGNPVANRSKWHVKSLGSACSKISDGTHHSPPIQAQGIPYVTAKHLKSYGLDFFSDPWFVSEADHHQIFSRCDPKLHDVLYIKDGATTGIAAVNKYEFEFSMLSSLALLRPEKALLDPWYLCHWLNHPMVKTEIVGAMAGVAIRRLTLAKIKAIPIPLPPLVLQEEFALKTSQIEQLQANHSASNSELDALFASLQHRAFRGEL